MGGALLRLAGCSEFLRNFAAKPQALSCCGVGADDSVRPYQLRLILAVGALRLWNLPKHPAHAEAAQEVQLFSARFFRVEQQNACVTRLVPKKAVAAGKIFREVRRIPRDQCVRCGFIKRHSDTRETGNGKQHTDGRKIHPKSAAPDREQSAQVSFQTAAGNLRVAPDGRGIWHCCLNRLQQPCVAAARRFAKQITASKVRWRHRTRREQVQFRGGLLFLFIKARNAAFSRRTGRKWIQNHGQAAFPVI